MFASIRLISLQLLPSQVPETLASDTVWRRTYSSGPTRGVRPDIRDALGWLSFGGLRSLAVLIDAGFARQQVKPVCDAGKQQHEPDDYDEYPERDQGFHH